MKILAYKPEVQHTDLTFVNETCQTSHVGHALICDNLRKRFLCIRRFLTEIYKTTDYFSEIANFQNFVKLKISRNLKMFCCFFLTLA